ncbi:MAG: Ribonuclease Z [Methanoregulaceae archaeon PtaB.Bin009]|nr:MAG: Ribonuclease Z [Methanoregulaceae archaeon PtaB.Bin009]HNQ30593.1 ribonuclease Z [Methanolinea sp.]
MSGETLHVYFLGTAAALPTPMRNPACIMIKRGRDTLLFDCGEGAQQQMMRARTGFLVDAVFITHWHADHFLGLFGLAQTLSFMGRTEPLTIYGPEWVHEVAASVRALSRYNVKFPVNSVEIRPGSVVRFSGYTVRAFETAHGMAGLGYVLEEDERPGRFNRQRAIELGVPPGPLFGRLQRGETVRIVKDGGEREVKPGDVMGQPRPGRKIVYTGDTRPIHTRIRELAHDPDLLIHDATYDDQAIDRAREVLHSTAGEAGEAAEFLNARRLALVHISSRYPTTAGHLKDASARFGGQVLVPSDLEMLEIPYSDSGEATAGSGD